MEFDFTEIFKILITLFSALITGFIIPILKQRLSNEKQDTLKTWTSIAVTAAEQIFGSKTGLEKKEFVVSFLLSKGIVVNIDEVTALIESEVYKLKACGE